MADAPVSDLQFTNRGPIVVLRLLDADGNELGAYRLSWITAHRLAEEAATAVRLAGAVPLPRARHAAP